ncbi:hypothetical protein WJX72_009534 [[Myrmecia] bisecta]|uniref:Large ribosomal subunit protein uL15/eL18 domain-containing protein n=1 Tax=[Myrmecia] bisecta TaxID=41462 RepID=A0AAW1QSA8_9CHLO
MAAGHVALCPGSLASCSRAKVASSGQSSFLRGQVVLTQAPTQLVRRASLSIQASAATAEGERLRLHNLAPQPGSRRKEKRKGRGYGAGQGGTCGFGMRGQKSRSGSSVRPGFEGGQTSLYRRLPKLRGIAGGMSAGLPKYVTINLGQLADFQAGEEVSLEALEAKRILNISGRETKLPLKVLGEGDLMAGLTIKAAKFSESAKEKIAAAGGQAVEVAPRPKWTRALHKERVAAAEAAAPKKK